MPTAIYDYKQFEHCTKTRVICTIGPASENVETIKEMVKAGMSVTRLNLAHGNEEIHTKYIRNIKRASQELGMNVGILADIPGPKYRLGQLSLPTIELKESQTIVLDEDPTPGTKSRVCIQPKGLRNDISVGALIKIDDGIIKLRVVEITSNGIVCKVLSSSTMQPRKSVSVPGFTSGLSYITEETAKAINYVKKSSHIDFLGLSYIRNAEDIRGVRRMLQAGGSTANPWLVAKIELPSAVDNIEEILEESDAIMVARGDLGVEIPLADIPEVQKKIIFKANQAGKPAITATQMLESMINLPQPTRAEVTDVHNAILDGTDAIMLSAETSVGKHPALVTKFMKQIALKAEQHADYVAIAKRRRPLTAVDDTIACNAVKVATGLKVKAIVAFTETGGTAQRVASFRPKVPIIAYVRDAESITKLSLIWGIIPIPARKYDHILEMFYEGSKISTELGYTKNGELIVVILGMPIGVPRNTNLLRVIQIPEPDPTLLYPTQLEK